MLFLAISGISDARIRLGQDQQEIYDLEIRASGGRPTRIAVPALEARPGAAQEAALLHRILWDDLHYSMAFEMIDPATYPDTLPGQTPPWGAWKNTHAEALVLGWTQAIGDQVIAEFRLFNVSDGRQVAGLRFTEPQSRVRKIAHNFADEAILHYTGIRGVASTQIAFISDRVDPRVKELFLMDYDGFGQFRVTHDNTINVSPSFAPQADRIAYTSYRAHGNIINTDLYMAFKTGGPTRALVTCRGLNSAAAFSPDGNWIAYSSSCAGNPELYRMRPDGSNQQRLTVHPSSETSPSWSPNGRELSFTTDRTGSPQIYVMGVDGTNARRLTTVSGQKDDSAWQPVLGELIAFTASTGGNNFDIFIYDLVSDRTFQLTRGNGRKEAPTWSPDGRQIAFEFSRLGHTQIWVMSLDGSRQRPVTQEGNNLSPTWGARS